MMTSLKRLWAAAHSQFSPSGVVFHSKGSRKRASGKAAQPSVDGIIFFAHGKTEKSDSRVYSAIF